MKNKFAVLGMLLVTATIWACNKEDNDDDPATPPVITPNTAFNALIAENIADAEQGFSVNAGWGSQIVATQGTRLNFSPGAFVHSDGTPVTGVVDVKVVEVLGIGDMIWLNKQTLGNDNGTLRLLRSGGALSITAFQGGEQLGTTEGGLLVEIPTLVGDPAMAFFSGTENTQGRMIWNPVDTVTVTVVPDYVEVYYTIPYQLSPEGLNWINCDYFYNYPDITPFAATIPDGQPTDSTQVWLAFPTQNAVTQIWNVNGQTYSTGGGYEVPVGMQVVVVGLYKNGSDYFSSFTNVTVTDNMNVPITFSPTTLAQFEAAVDAL
jgi:hypothetical protein